MAEIRFTEELVRRAVRRTVLRILGPLFFAALLLLAISVAIGLIEGNRGWFLGVTGAVLVLGTIVPFVAIRANTRAALLRLFALDNGKATLEISSVSLRISSRLGSVEFPLSRVTTVWRYPEYWVLLTGRSILMTIPMSDVASDTADSWLRELRAAGAKVS